MIRYLLDTDTVSYITKAHSLKIQERYRQTAPGSCAISAINLAEILSGLAPLGPLHPKRAKALSFLNTVQILDWPVEAAAAYGVVRHRLRKNLIGDRDMLIAAHAITLNATLVTNNTRHFSRIGPPLRIENWLE